MPWLGSRLAPTQKTNRPCGRPHAVWRARQGKNPPKPAPPQMHPSHSRFKARGNRPFNALRLGGTVKVLLCCDEANSTRGIYALLDTAIKDDELEAMADPAQRKRETAPGLADQWRHCDAICFCVSASCATAGACTPLLGPYPQAYTASQLRSLRRAPADLITGRITSLVIGRQSYLGKCTSKVRLWTQPWASGIISVISWMRVVEMARGDVRMAVVVVS